jgi:hypothetical protein
VYRTFVAHASADSFAGAAQGARRTEVRRCMLKRAPQENQGLMVTIRRRGWARWPWKLPVISPRSGHACEYRCRPSAAPPAGTTCRSARGIGEVHTRVGFELVLQIEYLHHAEAVGFFRALPFVAAVSSRAPQGLVESHSHRLKTIGLPDFRASRVVA